MQSRTKREGPFFDGSTDSIQEGTAASSGTQNITLGSEERRASYHAGLKDGTNRYFQSPLMESLAMEILFLRALVAQQEKRANFWHSRFADAVRELMR